MRKNTLSLSFALLSLFMLTSCVSFLGGDETTPPRQSAAGHNAPSSQTENPAFWQEPANILWGKLQHIPVNTLATYETSTDPTVSGWAKLAIISKQDSTKKAQLVQHLVAWREQYSRHPGNALFADNSVLNNLLATSPPQHLALLLPLTGRFATPGNAVKDGFLNAYYENLANTPNQTVAFYDTNANPSLANLYQEAVSKGADMVIGPLTKEQVKQLMSTTSLTVPTLALNYTDTGWLSSLPTNLYQFGLSPIDEVTQMADKASSEGYRRGIIIAPKTDWGTTAVKALSARWQTNGGQISEAFYFTEKSDLSKDIANLMHINQKEDTEKTRDQEDKTTLAEQRRQDFDVIFLLASPNNARVIVPLLRFYYLGKTPIYATSIIYAGTPQPQKDTDLNGVIFCDIPWILNKPGANRLFAVGRDAYFITQNMTQFTTLPMFPAYAATGGLSLTAQRQFYRRLPWVQMHDGHP